MKFTQWFSPAFKVSTLGVLVGAMVCQASFAAPLPPKCPPSGQVQVVAQAAPAKSPAKAPAKAAKTPAADKSSAPAAGNITAAAVAKGIGDDAPVDKPVSGEIIIPTNAADVAAGKALFGKNCTSCHGANGNGDGPAGMMLDPKPRNFHTDKLQYGADDAHLFTTVWLGAKHWKAAPPTSGMAGFHGTKVTKENVLQILAFVKHDLLGKK